jgi:hypothetical protein
MSEANSEPASKHRTHCMGPCHTYDSEFTWSEPFNKDHKCRKNESGEEHLWPGTCEVIINIICDKCSETGEAILALQTAPPQQVGHVVRIHIMTCPRRGEENGNDIFPCGHLQDGKKDVKPGHCNASEKLDRPYHTPCGKCLEKEKKEREAARMPNLAQSVRLEMQLGAGAPEGGSGSGNGGPGGRVDHF